MIVTYLPPRRRSGAAPLAWGAVWLVLAALALAAGLARVLAHH